MEASSSNPVENLSSEMSKLFVGGINESLNEEEIKEYFGKFGEVKDLVVVKDKVSGNVRGFGFVEFSDPGSAQEALDQKLHTIGERNVEVKRARPRGKKHQNYQSPQYPYPVLPEYSNIGLNSYSFVNNYYSNGNPTKSKKIFVGGLSSSITEDDFKSYFEEFGRITDVVIMYDNSTHRPRGFGFVTFDSHEAVDSVLKKSFHELHSKTVEVKVAVPKDSNNQNNFLHYSNGKMNGGIGYGFYHNYPPPNPRYGFYHNYPPPVPPFYHGGGYGIRPYGGTGFGAPFVRSPWGPQSMMVARRGPYFYGNAPMYPYYYNGGNDGYNGGYTTGNTNSKGTDDVGSEKLDVQQET